MQVLVQMVSAKMKEFCIVHIDICVDSGLKRADYMILFKNHKTFKELY